MHIKPKLNQFDSFESYLPVRGPNNSVFKKTYKSVDKYTKEVKFITVYIHVRKGVEKILCDLNNIVPSMHVTPRLPNWNPPRYFSREEVIRQEQIRRERIADFKDAMKQILGI